MTEITPSATFTIASASQVFGQFLHLSESKSSISIQELMEALNQYAFGIILIFFSLPNCIPLPPGISSVISMPLVFFGIQMTLGIHQPWLPARIMHRHISHKSLCEIMGIGKRLLRHLERYTHPRLIILSGSYAKRYLGIIVTIFGLMISLPLPGTNFVPALGVLFIALGLLERDGIAILIGLLIGSIGVILTLTIIYFSLFWISEQLFETVI